MKYLMLSYGSRANWDVGAGYAKEQHGVAEELMAAGEFVFAAGLSDPTHTQWVEVRGGVPLVTDGPEAEAAEFLASFGVIEATSHDRAVEIAAKMSEAFGRIELRPIDADTDGGNYGHEA
jgi:hypothetical protein